MNYSDNILLYLGIALLLGLMADYFFHRVKLSATAGYLFVGLLLGATGFGMIGEGLVVGLAPFLTFALGILAFMAGTTVQYEALARHGRGFLAMGLCGGVISFAITGGVMFWLFSRGGSTYAEAAKSSLVLAALACSIGPWTIRHAIREAKARGTVSAALNSVTDLGFLPLIIMYVLAETGVLFVEHGFSSEFAGQLALKLGGAGLLGVFFGIVSLPILKFTAGIHKTAAMILALVILCTGLNTLAGMDAVLAAFVLGMVMANCRPQIVKPEGMQLVKDLHLPVYIVFLILEMGRIDLLTISVEEWGLIWAFIASGCVARAIGSWGGGMFWERSKRIRKFLSIGMFGQSAFTIVLVLSVIAGREFDSRVVDIAIVSVLILQIAGPLCTRLALYLAGESGRNITDEDLMKEMVAGDVVNPNGEVIDENEPVNHILERFANGERSVYPVVTRDHELIGVLSFESLRGVLANHDSWQWLVAADLMTTVKERVTANEPLIRVYRKLETLKAAQIPVMDEDNNYKLLGMLDLNTIRMKVRSEILCRNHQHKGVNS